MISHSLNIPIQEKHSKHLVCLFFRASEENIYLVVIHTSNILKNIYSDPKVTFNQFSNDKQPESSSDLSYVKGLLCNLREKIG